MRPDSRLRHRRNARKGPWFRKNMRGYPVVPASQFSERTIGNQTFGQSRESRGFALIRAPVRHLDERAAAQALEAVGLGQVLGRFGGLHCNSTKGAVAGWDGGILRHDPASKADSTAGDMIQIKSRHRAAVAKVLASDLGQSAGHALRHAIPMWQTIATAPFDNDIELAVIDADGAHALVFPCRRILNGWMNAETKERLEVHPTHWRRWEARPKDGAAA
jgi:hypothetical protein